MNSRDTIILYFKRYPEDFFSSKDIETSLNISNSQVNRILNELVEEHILTRKIEKARHYFQLRPEQKEGDSKIPALDEKERLALNILLHSNIGKSILGSSIASLESKFQKAGLLTFHSEAFGCITSNRQVVNEKDGCNVETLLSAIETHTKIELEYRAANKDVNTSFILYPLGIYLRDDNIYLYAYRPDKESVSNYAYSRMKNIDYLYDDYFEMPDCMTLKEYISDPFGVMMDPPDYVTVRVIDTQAYYEKEKDWPEGTEITELEDGSIRMKLKVSDSWSFMRWVLAMGSYAIIEEPYDYAKWAYWEHRSGAQPYEDRYGREKLERKDE